MGKKLNMLMSHMPSRHQIDEATAAARAHVRTAAIEQKAALKAQKAALKEQAKAKAALLEAAARDKLEALAKMQNASSADEQPSAAAQAYDQAAAAYAKASEKASRAKVSASSLAASAQARASDAAGLAIAYATGKSGATSDNDDAASTASEESNASAASTQSAPAAIGRTRAIFRSLRSTASSGASATETPVLETSTSEGSANTAPKKKRFAKLRSKMSRSHSADDIGSDWEKVETPGSSKTERAKGYLGRKKAAMGGKISSAKASIGRRASAKRAKLEDQVRHKFLAVVINKAWAHVKYHAGLFLDGVKVLFTHPGESLAKAGRASYAAGKAGVHSAAEFGASLIRTASAEVGPDNGPAPGDAPQIGH